MKNGDVVFFQSAKTEPTRKAANISFKGHAFGILLGHVPPFAKAPPAEHMLRLMGTIGFISFDDVGEFFGNEIGADAVKKFEDKYYGKVVDPNAPELPLEPAKSDADGMEPGLVPPAQFKALVGLNGQPITSGDSNEDRPASV